MGYKHDDIKRQVGTLYRTDAKSIYGRSEAPIKLFIEKRAELHEENALYNKIFCMEKTKNAMDKFTSMTAMKGFSVVGEGEEYKDDEYGYLESKFNSIFESVTWRDRFIITQEMIEDSKLIDFKQKPAAFVDGYHRTREQFGAQLFAAAINGTTNPEATPEHSMYDDKFSFACLDGKNLFAVDHPEAKDAAGKVLGGFPQSNCFRLDDIGNEGKITPASFDALESKMQDFRDENGNILNICPDTILIPNLPGTKRRLFELIGADKSPYTANNGFNYQYGRWNIIVWQYLNQFVKTTALKTDDLLIMMDSNYNKEYRGSVWMDRIPLQVNSDIDIKTDNCIWKGRARFTAGFHDWRAFVVAGINSTYTPKDSSGTINCGSDLLSNSKKNVSENKKS